MLLAFFIKGDIDLRFSDETSFSMTPNIPYGWLPTGKQVGIPTDRKRVLNVFGLLNPTLNLCTYTTKQNINAQYVIDCIEDFSKTIDKQTVIVMDNAPWHKAKIMDEKIEQWQKKGLFIFYLPTYSPHLNIIEMLWKKMKYQWLLPKHYQSQQILKEQIIYILKNFGNDFMINFNSKLLR